MNMGSGSRPEDVPGAIAIFVDALLPGDELFPSASAVGAHGILAMRLRETVGSGAAEALATAFVSRGGLEAPEAAAASMEIEAPAIFETALTALYYAYYETPAVIAAIRSLGIVYNDAPQPNGYAMRPFDPAVDLPRERRGRFIPTGAVVRVDLSMLGLREGESV
jgi:hypothetical protein